MKILHWCREGLSLASLELTRACGVSTKTPHCLHRYRMGQVLYPDRAGEVLAVIVTTMYLPWSSAGLRNDGDLELLKGHNEDTEMERGFEQGYEPPRGTEGVPSPCASFAST